MLKSLKFYIRGLQNIRDLLFPQLNKITASEKQSLIDHHATDWRLAKLPEDANIIKTVTDIYGRDGKAAPKIIIYESESNNAFHMNNNTLAISTKKIAEADQQSLEASIAHEYGHDKQNSLTLTVMIARGVATLAAANFGANKLKPLISKTYEWGALATTALFVACAAVAHKLTILPWKAYRRWQENDADRWSVRLTGSAEGGIKNMERHAANRAKENTPEPEGFAKTWRDLNYEHPSHESRIANMRAEEVKLKGQVAKA